MDINPKPGLRGNRPPDESTTTVMEAVSSILTEALAAGAAKEDLHRMVEAADLPVAPALDREDDLITLAEASEQYGVKYRTLHAWIRKGHLIERDRLRWPGGGKILVSGGDVRDLIAHPPKNGRPLKTATSDCLNRNS